jgi:hypothetical protein
MAHLPPLDGDPTPRNAEILTIVSPLFVLGGSFVSISFRPHHNYLGQIVYWTRTTASPVISQTLRY